MAIINSNLSTCGLVEKYVGTAYDNVKKVGDNLENIDLVAECITDGTCDEIIALGPDITLAAALIHYRGIWNDYTTYLLGESVTHDDFLWISNATNLNSEPVEGNTNWQRYGSAGVHHAEFLTDLPSTPLEGQIYYVTTLNSTLNDAGGTWLWDSSEDKSRANLGTIYDPDKAADLMNQGTGAGAGCWVRQYSGSINAKWFGAVGDEVADDTLALQAAIDFMNDDDDYLHEDLAHTRKARSLFVPAGIYNFTQLNFWKLLDSHRGGWRFYGESCDSAGYPNYMGGTVFKALTFSGDAFVINMALGTNTIDDTGDYSRTNIHIFTTMRNIVMENFMVTGQKQDRNPGVEEPDSLVRCDLVVRHSVIRNVNIDNRGSGIALRLWSCYESLFENMLIYGDKELREGTGLYYDTADGKGGMTNFRNSSITGFDTCYKSSKIATSGVGQYGGGSMNIENVQFQWCNTAMYLSIGSQETICQRLFVEVTKIRGFVIAELARLTLNDSNVIIGESAYIDEANCVVEFKNNVNAEDNINKSEHFRARNCTLGLNVDANYAGDLDPDDPRGILIPEESEALIILDDIKWLLTSSTYKTTVLIYPPVVFHGLIVLDKIAFRGKYDGVNYSPAGVHIIERRMYYLSSMSQGHPNDEALNEDLNLSERVSLPRHLHFTTAGLSADITLKLPLLWQQLLDTGTIQIYLSDNTHSLFIDAGAGNLIDGVQIMEMPSIEIITLTPYRIHTGYPPTPTANFHWRRL